MAPKGRRYNITSLARSVSRHLGFARRRAHRSPAMTITISAGIAGNLSSRSEEHTSELQSLMRISYAVFCLKKKKTIEHELHNISNPPYISLRSYDTCDHQT